jgi:hypothetical protein
MFERLITYESLNLFKYFAVNKTFPKFELPELLIL